MSLLFKVDIEPPCKLVEHGRYYSSSWMIFANNFFDESYINKYRCNPTYNPLQAAFGDW